MRIAAGVALTLLIVALVPTRGLTLVALAPLALPGT